MSRPGRAGRLLRALPDLLGALVLAPLFGLWVAAGLLVGRRTAPQGRRLMVVDTAYSLHTIRSRRQDQAILCRDLDGFFDHVTTVHPLVGADETEPHETRFGPVRAIRLSDRHTVVESPIHRRPWLRRFPLTSFLRSQWSLLRSLRRRIRREGVAVLRIGDPYYQGLLGLFLKRTCKVPVLLRIGGNLDEVHAQTGQLAYPRILPTRRIEKAVERFVLPRVDLVAGANEDNLESAVRNGARPDRTTVFRYGNLVASEHFVPPADRPAPHDLPEGLDLGAPLLLFIGRLEPVKHVADLVEVMARVRERFPDARLVVVGDGSLRQPMADRARALGIQESIVFAGNRDQAWMSRLVPHVRVVAASHMGRALVEAALGGAPVVAYDHDWHRELVPHGEGGLLVPLGDVEAFSAAVVELLADPDRARAMGDALRERAYEMMHPDHLDRHERETYRNLLEQTVG